MRFFLAIFLSLFLVLPGFAQEAASTAAPAVELIRILEDDTARDELIERLRQAAPTEEAAAEPEVPALTDLSVARQLAEYTRSVAEGASATIRGLGETFGNLQTAFTNGASASSAEIRGVAINIGVLMVGL